MGSVFSRQSPNIPQREPSCTPLQPAPTNAAAAVDLTAAPETAAAAQIAAHDLLHECFATVQLALPGTAAPAKQLATAPHIKQEGSPHTTCEAMSISPAVNRKPAEWMVGNIDGIAKGYNSTPLDRHHVLLAANDGILTGSKAQLLDQIPDQPGSYMFLIRAPHAQHFFPIYKGQAGGPGSKATLRTAFERYLHGGGEQYAGTIGDTGDMAKYIAVVDAMSRGFSLQFRFRTQPVGEHVTACDDGKAELAHFDFPLNAKNNGHRRPISVPLHGGKASRPITDYAVVHQELAAVVTRCSSYALV